MIDWHLALYRLRPGAHYGTLGDPLDPAFDYDNMIEWRDESTSKPTLTEVKQAWKTIEAEEAAEKVTSTDWSTQINAMTSPADTKELLLQLSAAIEALSRR